MRMIAVTLTRGLLMVVLALAIAASWGGATASAGVVANATGSDSTAARQAATAVPSSSGVVKTPAPPTDGPPADACTVEVNGEKKHGRSDGSSWCCLNKGTLHEECWNCSTYTCTDGWNLIEGPGGGGIKQFEMP